MPSLRDILKPIPQDGEFHPEGDVWTHSRLVRESLEEAIAMLPMFHLGKADRNLLRIAAWCHDIGKVTATSIRGGRVISPEHDKPKYLNAGLRQLGPRWRKLWNKATFDERKAFTYLCRRHMAVSDQRGVDPEILRAFHSKDPARSRRAKLVIVLMVMDRLGTSRPSRIDDVMIVIPILSEAKPSHKNPE